MSLFSKKSIKFRLMSGIVTVIFFMLLVGFAGLHSLSKLTNIMNYTQDDILALQAKAMELQIYLSNLSDKLNSIYIAKEEEPAKQLIATLEKDFSRYRDTIAFLSNASSFAEIKPLINELIAFTPEINNAVSSIPEIKLSGIKIDSEITSATGNLFIELSKIKTSVQELLSEYEELFIRNGEALKTQANSPAISEKLERLIKKDFEKLRILKLILDDINEINNVLRGAMLENTEMFEPLLEMYRNAKENMEKHLALLKQTVSDDNSSLNRLSLFTESLQVIDSNMQGKNGIFPLYYRKIETLKRGEKELAEIDRILSGIDKNVSKITGVVERIVISNKNEISRLSTFSTRVIIFSLIFSLILSTAYSLFTSTGLVNQIKLVANRSELIATGNLQTEKISVKSEDEIGKLASSFNTMMENLSGLLGEINSASKKVRHAAEQIFRSFGEMSEVLRKQTELVTNVSSAMAEMAASIEEITANSRASKERSLDAYNSATSGAVAVRDTIDGLNAIASSIRSACDVTKQLGERSKEIEGILNTITDISDQTNLLALNAAIEAARAGEQGRGFAVVADEVRRLAERSSSSASKIGDIIDKIQDEINRNIETMNETSKVAMKGMALSETLATSFARVQDSISITNRSTEEISAALEQQALVVGQIVHSIEEISHAIAKTEKGFDALTDLVGIMKETASNLDSQISKFKV